MAAAATIAPAPPLTSAGLELIRNRTASEVAAARLAALASGAAAGGPLSGDDDHSADLKAWQYAEDWRVRLGAASALSRQGAAQLAGHPELRALLSDKDEGVRQLAAERLAEPSAKASSEAVAEGLLKSQDWRLRRGALQSLALRGEKPVEHARTLADLLVADPQSEVRVAARELLAGLGAGTSVAALAVALGAEAVPQSPRGDTVSAAEELLLALLGGDCTRAAELVPSSAHFRSLVQEKLDAEEQARQESLRWQERDQQLQEDQTKLQQLQLQQLQLLEEEEKRVPTPTFRPPPSRPKPEVQFQQRRPHRKKNEYAAVERDFLLEPRPAYPPNRAELELTEAANRLQAVQDLEALGPDELLARAPELLDWLRNSCASTKGVGDHISVSMAGLLGRLGALAGPEHVLALVQQLASDHARLRQAAARALGQLLPKIAGADATVQHAAVQGVARLLEDGDAEVRRTAAQALSAFGPEAAGAAAAAHLRSGDSAVRRMAQRALLEMKLVEEEQGHASPGQHHQRLLQVLEPHLEPILRAAPGEEEPETQAAAASVLEKLRSWGMVAAPMAQTTPAASSSSEEAASVPQLLAYLCHEDASVRLKAVEDLTTADMADSGVLRAEDLAALAALHIDPHWAVRLALAEGLGRLRRPASKLVLLCADDDWRVRRAAKAAAALSAAEEGSAR
eukprot:TRINITY_DN62164_c0_g1_i2.p1 TRINITY_DN62164_c0_g1~~TRINITY_DN62164_c0_g1_i2.p1  ORF type:complete len:684 (+),score=176.57 TRINITY_DN62164_c0_g1_i2:27-2078(+)